MAPVVSVYDKSDVYVDRCDVYVDKSDVDRNVGFSNCWYSSTATDSRRD